MRDVACAVAALEEIVVEEQQPERLCWLTPRLVPLTSSATSAGKDPAAIEGTDNYFIVGPS